ncbi:MAG: DUF4832 domain-containing protein [Armatimonadetes bacterium]|jgi:hypothetical protein|nr:DUF4832 domain-containing protein [Armatimonadota bacterium]
MICLLSCLLLLGMGLAVAADAEAAPAPTRRYHGIRPTDPRGREGLRNPERGWRIETLFGEPEGVDYVWGPAHHLKGKVSPGFSDDWWVLDCRRYESDGLTLAQTYCYLDQFVGKPLSAEKLACLQRGLDALRANGLKAVLRFAYEKDMPGRNGPVLANILEHIDQLAPIIRKNTDVIFVMQAGFVGAWGEWHSSTHGLEGDHAALAAIVDRILKVLPADRMTQVRVPKYKRWVLSQPVFGGHRVVNAQTAHTGVPEARIGFNNDGFLAGKTCGGTWNEEPFFSNPGNPEFDYMTEESPYVAIDGELFWADQGGKVDGLQAATRLRLHHYSSFSLAHSFSEREGKPYSIDDWKVTPLTEAQVREAKLPLSDGYFRDGAGAVVPRTQFEYIRDHLGYRLELQQATFPRSARAGGRLPVTIELVNRGFSTLHNPRPVLLALVAGDGQVTELPVNGADPRRWQPFEPGDPDYQPLTHRVAAEVRLPANLRPGTYRLGLWLPDAYTSIRRDARYAVRVANRDVPWWTNAQGEYGINVLGEIQVVGDR